MKNLNMCTTIEKTLFWAPYDVVIPASYAAVGRAVHQAVGGIVDGVVYQALHFIGQDPVYGDPLHPKLELYLGSMGLVNVNIHTDVRKTLFWDVYDVVDEVLDEFVNGATRTTVNMIVADAVNQNVDWAVDWAVDWDPRHPGLIFYLGSVRRG